MERKRKIREPCRPLKKKYIGSSSVEKKLNELFFVYKTVISALKDYDGFFGSVKVRTSRIWAEINKKLACTFPKGQDIQSFLKTLKLDVINAVEKLERVFDKKSAFVCLAKDILLVFDYVEPLYIKKCKYITPEDELNYYNIFKDEFVTHSDEDLVCEELLKIKSSQSNNAARERDVLEFKTICVIKEGDQTSSHAKCTVDAVMSLDFFQNSSFIGLVNHCLFGMFDQPGFVTDVSPTGLIVYETKQIVQRNTELKKFTFKVNIRKDFLFKSLLKANSCNCSQLVEQKKLFETLQKFYSRLGEPIHSRQEANRISSNGQMNNVQLIMPVQNQEPAGWFANFKQLFFECEKFRIENIISAQRQLLACDAQKYVLLKQILERLDS